MALRTSSTVNLDGKESEMSLTTDLWRAMMPGCDGMAEMVDVFLAEVERQGATVTRGPTYDSDVTIEGAFILSFALSDAYIHRITQAGVKSATPEGEARGGSLFSGATPQPQEMSPDE
jgi:hypothetical protein